MDAGLRRLGSSGSSPGGQQLFDRIHRLFEGRRGPTSPVVHAALWRLCAERIGHLRNRLREPLWRGEAATLRRQLAVAEATAPSSLIAAARQALRAIPRRREKRLLVAAAAVLQALDGYHRRRRSVLERRVFELPLEGPSRDGARTVFLAPPERPLEQALAEPLVRGVGDYRNDLRSYLGLWWHLVPLEGRAVLPRYRELDAEAAAVLAERAQKPLELTIGLASPCAGLGYRIDSDAERCDPADGTPYRFVSLEPGDRPAARAALGQIVAVCAEHRVDLLCLPELTLDTDLVRHLAGLLGATNDSDHPALVMAGSFHLPGDQCWQNRATVLDGSGRTLFGQSKCVAFKLPPARARALGEAGRQLLGIDERGGYEDVDVGSDLEIVDSPLGRLATPICLDYCGDELTELVIASAVNLFLVPAMSERMKPFHDQALRLGSRTRAASFAVNSAWLLRQLGKSADEVEKELLVMGYLPRRGGLATTAAAVEGCEDLRLFTIRVLSGGD